MPSHIVVSLHIGLLVTSISCALAADVYQLFVGCISGVRKDNRNRNQTINNEQAPDKIKEVPRMHTTNTNIRACYHKRPASHHPAYLLCVHGYTRVHSTVHMHLDSLIFGLVCQLRL